MTKKSSNRINISVAFFVGDIVGRGRIPGRGFCRKGYKKVFENFATVATAEKKKITE